PFISVIYALIEPALTPLVVPIQALLSKMGPFRWVLNKMRNIKAIQVVKCSKCRKDMPSDSLFCPYCRVKITEQKKDVPHKKRGS
ncbi:MAG: hypothetical protein V1703_04145, partial [Candidatus Altiarchaeota archaeon]